MKKTIRSFTLLMLLLTLVSSCKKYPDGPALSIATKKARLSGIWLLQSVKINGTDKTTDFAAAYPNYILRIDKIGNFFVHDKYDELDRGTWKFDEGKDFVILSSTITGITTLQILELKRKELGYTYKDPSGDEYEMRYVVQKN